MELFKVELGGITRKYPIVRLSEGIKGVYFFLPGDLELIERCAELISEKLSCLAFDIIMVPEVGGIPLAHSLARLTTKNYIVVRKDPKLYMERPIIENIRSITTQGVQQLVLDARDAPKIKQKKVLILDDVISTRGTLEGLIQLVNKCKARLTGIATIFLEGYTETSSLESLYNCPVISLGYLPLFLTGNADPTMV